MCGPELEEEGGLVSGRFPLCFEREAKHDERTVLQCVVSWRWIRGRRRARVARVDGPSRGGHRASTTSPLSSRSRATRVRARVCVCVCACVCVLLRVVSVCNVYRGRTEEGHVREARGVCSSLGCATRGYGTWKSRSARPILDHVADTVRGRRPARCSQVGVRQESCRYCRSSAWRLGVVVVCFTAAGDGWKRDVLGFPGPGPTCPSPS